MGIRRFGLIGLSWYGCRATYVGHFEALQGDKEFSRVLYSLCGLQL